MEDVFLFEGTDEDEIVRLIQTAEKKNAGQGLRSGEQAAAL